MAILVRGDLSLGRRLGRRRRIVGSSLWRRLLLPALTSLAMLALTLSLGVWQVERLHWKRALLAEIDRGEVAEPVSLATDPVAFSRVIAEGTFGPSVARYGAELRATANGPSMGAHIIGLLQRPGALPVVVDRGWAPIDWNAPVSADPVRIVGYIRPPEIATWSAASDDLVARRFFTLNPAVIGAALGARQVAPFTLVALGPAQGFPEPATALPRPPNDHLSYAITWFSLSAVLFVVFTLFVRQTLSKRSRP